MLSVKLGDTKVPMADDFQAKALAYVMTNQIPTIAPEDLKGFWNLEAELKEITASLRNFHFATTTFKSGATC
jgi:hypothetical protein